MRMETVHFPTYCSLKGDFALAAAKGGEGQKEKRRSIAQHEARARREQVGRSRFAREGGPPTARRTRRSQPLLSHARTHARARARSASVPRTREGSSCPFQPLLLAFGEVLSLTRSRGGVERSALTEAEGRGTHHPRQNPRVLFLLRDVWFKRRRGGSFFPNREEPESQVTAQSSPSLKLQRR